MSVLLVTKSDDNDSVELVAAAIRARGGEPIRLDSDLYPLEVAISAGFGPGGRFERRLAGRGGDAVDLGAVTAIWYRRFDAGRSLPADLGDTREHCVAEARRTLFGTIAAMEGFQLDPWICVRKADHKELQLSKAAAFGLDVPRTLFTNDPAAVRRFAEETGGRLITKMQSSFAIYRDGKELVVYTTPVSARDLEDLAGLRYSPMTFQEWLPKRFDVRATVVGRRVLAARIDSQRQEHTATDWRRDGLGTLDDWESHALPAAVERGLLDLTEEFGLNYAAADFVLTPDDRHVFLEINAGGEWFWLDRRPGLKIADAIADVLLGLAPRARPLGPRAAQA